MEMTALEAQSGVTREGCLFLSEGPRKVEAFPSFLLVSKPAESFQRLLGLDYAKTFHWLPTALK